MRVLCWANVGLRWALSACCPPNGMASAMGVVALATFLPAPQSTGKVWGRSIRTRFLKDAIHGAAQRGRCWAEEPGDALGKESSSSACLVVFLQPFVTSAAGEDELEQLQHSPADTAG